MLDLALAWLGGILIGVALILGNARRRPSSDLTFPDVCRAAGRAKQKRMDPEAQTRDFIDGADAVLAELMEDGHGESPEEMEIAYRAGGEEVELEP